MTHASPRRALHFAAAVAVGALATSAAAPQVGDDWHLPSDDEIVSENALSEVEGPDS